MRSFAAAVRAESSPSVFVKMDQGAGGHGGYGGHSGFGADRRGRGRGQNPAKNLTWERTDKGKLEDHQGAKDSAKSETVERWEGRSELKPSQEEKWNNNSSDLPKSSHGNKANQGNKAPQGPDNQPASNQNLVKPPCDICGLQNHETRDYRRLHCEIYGMNNHMAYDCKRFIPWNCGPELCATQVEDQSFFFIEEDIDPRMAREKDTTAVVSIVKGKASGKDIEMEFKNIIGSET